MQDTRDTEQFGLITIRTGTEIGIDFAILESTTNTPITILSVQPVGKGIGNVVRPVEIKIASGRVLVPRSAYIEDPPVIDYGNGRCGVQQLSPVNGYVLRRGLYQTVNVWTVLLGARPGRYNITGQVVTYSQGAPVTSRPSCTATTAGSPVTHRCCARPRTARGPACIRPASSKARCPNRSSREVLCDGVAPMAWTMPHTRT